MRRLVGSVVVMTVAVTVVGCRKRPHVTEFLSELVSQRRGRRS
ncbi:hypothetical protein [Mycobacterium sp. ITM-2016-00318]|nr:hypothetical protein [Mycobacterium sp. ITM-2016-00318]WNG93994.1 hypothetical protein C6A82_005945 [Mycobacterium sp. ITM-2016-00318]